MCGAMQMKASLAETPLKQAAVVVSDTLGPLFVDAEVESFHPCLQTPYI